MGFSKPRGFNKRLYKINTVDVKNKALQSFCEVIDAGAEEQMMRNKVTSLSVTLVTPSRATRRGSAFSGLNFVGNHEPKQSCHPYME